MSQTNFRSLQNRHEGLLQKQQGLSEENQQDFTKEVKEYIEEAKRGGSYISSNRERDQLRANLRYWANYVYSIEKTFPDTELAPSSVASKPFSPAAIGVMAIFVLGIAVLTGGIFALRSAFTTSSDPATETALPLATPTVAQLVPTFEPTEVTQVEESPSPESSGFNVILSSPSNGASITPNIEFKGTFDNLRPGWAIHVLLIKGDKFFPIQEHYPIPDQVTGNDWMIQTTLTESPEEIAKAQSYSIVLALSLDLSSRELLSNSTESGIDINSLPSTVISFQDTSRVVYRDAYIAIQESRIVYSLHDGTSYDIYTSKPDGSDIRKITNTQAINELSPSLSPDGKKIVYVKLFPSTITYTISIMDSNGQNDNEIINGEDNILERPKWSSDSAFISYAMGDTSSNPPLWSIHAYSLLTEENQSISGEPEVLANRHFSWIPNKHTIVFNARTRNTSRFIQVPIDSLETLSVFFDPQHEVIQPNIETFGNGYLLTYTVVNPDFVHEIYAVIDSDTQFPFDGSPVKLTRENNGADLPIFEPPNSIYYIGTGNNIFEVKFTVEENKIILDPGTNINDGEYYGDLIIETGQGQRLSSFDIGNMVAFFPIQ